ncbi:MAG: carbohydrate ABC transporter permease [Caldilineaceae bacterium]|nr:carbohydrate ABC transporter permease [Caldilineaceae bacterium]
MAATFGGIRSRRAATSWQVVSYIIMIVISVATVVPFLFMASTSFTESFTMMTYPPTLLPDNPSLKNYYEIIVNFQGGLFPRWFFNTVFTTAMIVGGSLLLNTLSGYIFAKKEFYGRNVVFALLLSTMMVPRAVTLIPAFQIVNLLGLFNTYWALILPGLASAFGIFMMRQFISSLPTELIEVSKIDGASELRIFLVRLSCRSPSQPWPRWAFLP